MSRYEKQPVMPKHQIQVDIYQDFEGTKAELYFIKFTAWLRERKKNLFVGLGIIGAIVVLFAGYSEYHDSRVEKASVILEKLHKFHQMNPVDIARQIKDFEKTRSDFSESEIQLRTAKILADLYARNGEFAKAAELMEEAGTDIDDLREVKAFYFYIAGNYREQASQPGESLKDYETAANLVTNMRNMPGFMAWIYYQTGRLHYLNNNKEEAVKNLKKVMELNGNSEQFQKARQLSSYLLVKMNQ